MKPLKFRPYWEKWGITIPTVNFDLDFPIELFGFKTMEIDIPSYKIKAIYYPPLGDTCSKCYPHWLCIFHWVSETGVLSCLSLLPQVVPPWLTTEQKKKNCGFRQNLIRISVSQGRI